MCDVERIDRAGASGNHHRRARESGQRNSTTAELAAFAAQLTLHAIANELAGGADNPDADGLVEASALPPSWIVASRVPRNFAAAVQVFPT